jgi:cytochrome oxidase Cu insertion factor (SCO1/SenC/PrrC family)
MTRSIRPIVVALIATGLWLSSPSVAADLDTLMQQFRVTPAGLKPAPAFSLKTIDGKTTALTEHRGRPVLLYFWATW